MKPCVHTTHSHKFIHDSHLLDIHWRQKCSCGSALGASYSPDPSFPRLSRVAHTGRIWEPNYAITALMTISLNPHIQEASQQTVEPDHNVCRSLLENNKRERQTLWSGLIHLWSVNLPTHCNTCSCSPHDVLHSLGYITNSIHIVQWIHYHKTTSVRNKLGYICCSWV